jgi:alpha-beta hydrolase superfamily lysophospholipase
VAGYLAADVLSCFDFLVRELRSDFTSAGTLCRGWLYLPEGVTRPPVIVLAHGISLTHSFPYWRRAEAYAAAGFAVFDFDPRFVGCSDGEPRQMVSVRRQREDLVDRPVQPLRPFRPRFRGVDRGRRSVPALARFAA